MKTQRPFILFIRGTSGAGKTITARTIAKEKKAVLLSHDTFLFDMLPYKPENEEHYTLGNRHFLSCFQNALFEKKNIVIEGALVSLDPKINTFSLKSLIQEGQKKKYRITQVLLTSDFKVANTRMKKRGTIVPKGIYQKISQALQKSRSSDEFHIDTSALSEEMVVISIRALLK